MGIWVSFTRWKSSYLVLTSDAVKKNIIVLPKSVTHTRILSNLKGTVAAAEKLTEEDIATLDAVEANGKHLRVVTPPWGAFFMLHYV